MYTCRKVEVGSSIWVLFFLVFLRLYFLLISFIFRVVLGLLKNYVERGEFLRFFFFISVFFSVLVFGFRVLYCSIDS